jgi:predicted NUDIX family NTP pyrophosphohydrolase
MSKRTNVSAGLLLFRRNGTELEYFLAHPGGPFWRRREEGAWTIPKGILEAGEQPFEGAIREFTEETGIVPRGPYIELGSVRQKSGKVVHAWAWEGDADPGAIQSNETRLEFPRGSGRWITHPEVDRCGWFGLTEALRLINPSQVPLLKRLRQQLQEREG